MIFSNRNFHALAKDLRSIAATASLMITAAATAVIFLLPQGKSNDRLISTVLVLWISLALLSGAIYYFFHKRMLKYSHPSGTEAIRHLSKNRPEYMAGCMTEDETGRPATISTNRPAYKEKAESTPRESRHIFEQIAGLQTLEAAHQSETLQTLFKNLEQGIAIFDKDLKLAACNSRWHILLHQPLCHSKQGTSLHSICQWDAQHGFAGEGFPVAPADELMAQYEKRESVLLRRTYDDGMVCEINVFPVASGGLVLIVTDVSERRHMEGTLKYASRLPAQNADERMQALRAEIEERKRIEEILIDNQARLIRAQKLSRIGYWGWGLDSGRTFMCDEYPRILGLEPDQVPLYQAGFNKLLHPDDFSRVSQHFNRMCAEEPQNFELDYRIVRPDGAVRYIREIGEPEYDESGKAVGHAGIIQDVTAIREMETALIRAKEEAEIANRTKSEFLANMSHELRTPLNAVIGFSDILKQETFGPLNAENYMQYVEDIRESGVHLLDILNDILDMSKIEAGEVQLEEEKFEIKDELDRSLRFVYEKAFKKNIELNVFYSEDRMFLYADRRIFKQIMLNLFSNALKFTNNGGRVLVDVSYLEDDSIQLRVEDNGIGIAEEDIGKIMLPFKQVQTLRTRNFEGTGLGLALVKNFTKLHQGRVEISSRLGEGTDVSVIFPPERRPKSPPA